MAGHVARFAGLLVGIAYVLAFFWAVIGAIVGGYKLTESADPTPWLSWFVLAGVLAFIAALVVWGLALFVAWLWEVTR